MKSMRPVSTLVLAAMWLGGFSACTSVLTNTPVSKNGDGWVLTLSQVQEGPDEYVGDVGTVAAGAGDNLIWTILTVKNENAQDDTFSYETCALQGERQSRQPLVIAHADVNSPADRSESIPIGEERTRRLLYAYPDDQRPTRMKCGTVVLPIPAPR